MIFQELIFFLWFKLGPSSSIGRSTKYEGASETVGDSSRVEASPNSSFPDVTDEELPDVSRCGLYIISY